MRNRLRFIALATTLAALTTAAPAMAQGKGNDGIPPGQRPAAGMCRIWINGVPPGRQPRATDCATARAQLPANARILYGPGTTIPGRRTFISNGQVVTQNGRRCLQRTDINGRVSTVCANRDEDDDHLMARAHRDDDDHRLKGEKHKDKDKDGDKDKGKKPKDHDGDHDRGN